MRTRAAVASLLFCVSATFVTASAANGQDHPSLLAEAKRAYELAEYDAAVDALEGIDATRLTPAEVREKALYEALCLLALDRKADADTRIENVVRADPLFRLTADMPPRLVTAVEEVRNRLRPSLVERHYLAGKERFDHQDYAGALNEFELVVALTDAGGDGGAPPLGDVRILAVGFRDLSRRAGALALASSTPATASQAAANTEVVPPVTLQQNLPALPAAMNARLRHSGPLTGMLEIHVSEQGVVSSMKVVKPVHPLYDPLLMTAARQWRYRPATRNGVPIQYVKQLEVTLKAK